MRQTGTMTMATMCMGRGMCMRCCCMSCSIETKLHTGKIKSLKRL